MFGSVYILVLKVKLVEATRPALLIVIFNLELFWNMTAVTFPSFGNT